MGGRWLHAMRPYDEQLELALSAGMALQPSESQRNKRKQTSSLPSVVVHVGRVERANDPKALSLSLSAAQREGLMHVALQVFRTEYLPRLRTPSEIQCT